MQHAEAVCPLAVPEHIDRVCHLLNQLIMEESPRLPRNSLFYQTLDAALRTGTETVVDWSSAELSIKSEYDDHMFR